MGHLLSFLGIYICLKEECKGVVFEKKGSLIIMRCLCQIATVAGYCLDLLFNHRKLKQNVFLSFALLQIDRALLSSELRFHHLLNISLKCFFLMDFGWKGVGVGF